MDNYPPPDTYYGSGAGSGSGSGPPGVCPDFCVPGFVQNGGCEAMGSMDEEKMYAAIPPGCEEAAEAVGASDDCGNKAMAACGIDMEYCPDGCADGFVNNGGCAAIMSGDEGMIHAAIPAGLGCEKSPGCIEDVMPMCMDMYAPPPMDYTYYAPPPMDYGSVSGYGSGPPMDYKP